jgi:predicted MFS family arabinose efflux permease
MATSVRMRLLIPEMAWTGISIAYYSGVLVMSISDVLTSEGITNQSTQFQYTMFAMACFGAGEVVGSGIIGYVVDKFGSRKTCFYNVGVMIIMTLVTIVFLIVGKFNWLAFAMTFMWGIQDSSTNTHCMEMLGFEFDDNAEPYSVFNLTQALAVFIF